MPLHPCYVTLLNKLSESQIAKSIKPEALGNSMVFANIVLAKIVQKKY